MADSVFKDVENAPPIEVFQLTKLYNECQSPDKVNLGVGAYRNEEGKPWVLPVVQTAELQMANDRTLNHEYLPVAGLPDFRSAATRLLLGSNHKVISENRVEGFQALGGTGALRLGAAFLKNVLKFDIVYVSNPTWGNHKGVFKAAGFSQIREYRYWDNDKRDLNFTGMCEDLSNAPPNSVVILHAVAHNPTGVDPTKEQWQQICKLCQEKKLFVLLDCAYQGFASGDLNDDGYASRYFADQDIDMFIAQSFSKNFGLYNERTGNLIVVTRDAKKLPQIRSQMEIQIRVMWSNPPNHGARIVTTVLNNKAYYEDWKGQILTMADRIKKMRQELVDNLKKLGTPGSWDHIIRQIGMFSYTGLSEKQVEYMKSKSIFLLGSGRISMAGLTSKNVVYVAKIMDEAVRAHPTAAGTQGYFLEFAKRKLQKTLDYNSIRTPVIVDGELIREEEEIPEDADSVESFIKIRLDGIISSSSLSWHEQNELLQVEPEEDATEAEVMPVLSGSNELGAEFERAIEEQEMPLPAESVTSAASKMTEPGTPRTSVKTYKTRSIQTYEKEEVATFLQPLKVPARFEGTMLTPVYFEGHMLTPEKLDNLLSKGGDQVDPKSINVKFQGGMLTAAFKTLAQNLEMGEGTEPVPVKFHGRLQGAVDPTDTGKGLPVAFDGNMVPNKSKKGKGTATN